MRRIDSRRKGERLLPLAQAAELAEEAGSKAARLGSALAAGFPVPAGFVLTATLLEACGGDAMTSTDLEACLREALERLRGPLAVRSSALAEDLGDASYAGQYDTVLGVEGLEALRAAVRRCCASESSDRVEAYEGARSRPRRAGMAVLIQRLIRAEAAGVAFTAHPVSGDRSETLVSAVRGLGERLVSGRATPDEWRVRDGVVTCVRADEMAIDAVQVLQIARLAKRLEQHFGTPQDIEWAIEQGDVHLLQARPITALPSPQPVATEQVPMPVAVPGGFWEREASHAPSPHSPMNRSLIFERRNAAFRMTFARFGVLADGLEFREIGGWEYTRLVPPGGKDRPPPPPPLMWLLARLHPTLRRRTRAARQAIRSDLPGRAIRRWHEEIRPDLQARITSLQDVALDRLPDQGLLEHWSSLETLLDDALPVHFDLHAPIALARKELVDSCAELLGWDEAKALELLAGLSEASTAPAVALAELTRAARERPAVLELIERADRATARRLQETDGAFAGAFAAYQRAYGIRGLRYEVAEETLAEAPEITLATIRDQLRRDYDPSTHAASLARRRHELLAEAEALLADRPPAQREHFDRVLARAQQAHPTHEENEFYTISAPVALIRYALLELGRRLSERSVIAEADDVFFLEIREALTALSDGGDRRDVVRRRKGERVWVLAHPGPPSYGEDPGPPPPVRVLPRESRRVMEAVLWSVNRGFAAERSAHHQSAGRTIRGVAASAGQRVGTVRVVLGEHEFHKLEAGDVLVCPVTSPVWSVLFSRIGALVTDTGGILSHPAIIAREYAVPAVVATGNATSLLRDGQRVRVDGTAGVVDLID